MNAKDLDIIKIISHLIVNKVVFDRTLLEMKYSIFLSLKICFKNKFSEVKTFLIEYVLYLFKNIV